MSEKPDSTRPARHQVGGTDPLGNRQVTYVRSYLDQGYAIGPGT